ncbi:MAG: hypothetical protein ACLR23_12505 [Clostridia bacterium]
MFAKIVSCTLSGVQGIPVDVETCISAGMPYFSIVGLSEGQPDSPVSESEAL